MPKSISGYIFDYGGTLDTGGNHWGRVLWHSYERQGVPVTEQQFREAYVFAERTLGRQPIVKPWFTFRETLASKLKLQFEHLLDRGWLKADLQDKNILPEAVLADAYRLTQQHTKSSAKVLAQLKAQGYPLVLVSNFYGNMNVVLEEFGFKDLFLRVVESAAVGIRKPDPRIFLKGVEALGLQPAEVAVVGDSLTKDIDPAHQAGCQTIWLRGEQWDDTVATGIQPDRIIISLEELVN